MNTDAPETKNRADTKDRAAQLAGRAGSLRKKIKAKSARLDELRDQGRAATERAEEAEADFADGHADPEDVEAHRQRAETLRSAAERVERQTEALRSGLEDVEAEREREDALQLLEALAERAATLRTRHDDTMQQLASAIQRLATGAADAREEWANACGQFRESIEELDDPAGAVRELRERGTDLIGALSHRRQPRRFDLAQTDDVAEIDGDEDTAREAVRQEVSRRKGRRQEQQRQERQERAREAQRAREQQEAARRREVRTAAAEALRRETDAALTPQDVASRTGHPAGEVEQALLALEGDGKVTLSQVHGQAYYAPAGA